MSTTPGSGNLEWRVQTLEREVRELKAGEPAVIAERVAQIRTDVRDFRRHVDERFEALRKEIEAGDGENEDELRQQRRILIGAFVSIATGLVIAYVLGSRGTSAVGDVARAFAAVFAYMLGAVS